ncbi:MAG TPA: type II secretion system F family protein [Opitutaceae bacterium]|nr:type II secretion system F family protein [Opitutaceae bacterium]
MPAAALWSFRVFVIRHRGRKREVEVFSPASHVGARFAAGKADDEELSEKKVEGFDQWLRSRFARRSATTSELEKFYNGMAEAFHVGADFRSALDLVAPAAETPYFRGVIAALYEQKGSVATISGLMRQFPGAFNHVAVSMIEQGEVSGKLEQVFEKLALMTRNKLMISGEIKSGLYYPGFIGVLLLIALIIVNFMVLPMITANFTMFHTKLPPATQALFDGLTFFSTHPYFAFLPLLVVVWTFLQRSWLLSRRTTQRLIVRLPKVGLLFQKEILARCLRTLSMLYQSGVYQRDAFAITANVAGYHDYQDYFLAVSEHLSRSASLYQAFLRERHRIGKVGKSLADQMKVASGAADPSQLLSRIAALYEEQALRDAKNLPKLIEPLLTLIILGFVGFLAGAIYLPNLYLMAHIAANPGLVNGP